MDNIHSSNRLSKEIVASRMFRNAAQHWGYNDTEIDNFDPLIKLLIEACSVEIFTINNEIINVQQRMLERLAKMLTPDVYTSAKPAHAIMHARCSDTSISISPTTQFFIQRKVASKANGVLDSNLDLFFSPAGNFKIFNADVKFLFCGNNLYQIADNQGKEILFRSENNVSPYTAWLALEVDNNLDSLAGLSFYFDFKNQPDKQQLFQLLSYSKLSVNGKNIDIESGIYDAGKGIIYNENLSALDEFKVTPITERKARQFYSQQFITIKADDSEYILANEKLNYPNEFDSYFSNSDLNVFKEKYIWFKFTFPANFSETHLNELSVSINSFPVVNKKINEIRYRLQSYFNIIPLITSDDFLDINSVKNISGKSYYANPIEKNDLDKKGTYSVRSTGVERFDSRNANELLNYLNELLRDESNAFAAYGQDFIANLIKELNQNIGLIDQKIKQNAIAINTRSTFLFVKPFEENENIFVDFWTTNGELANNIRSGTRMELYAGNDINRNGLSLLTNTNGGSAKLKSSQLLYAYKNALLSRDRIVTQQDILNTCIHVWSKRLDSVDVRKGVMESVLPEEGLVRTTDVFLKINKEQVHEEEVESLKHELLLKLNQNSIVENRYRVFVES